MEGIDYQYMFVLLFNFIYNICRNINSLFAKKYLNTFIYDKDLKCIFVRGYQSNKEFKIKIPHHELLGSYTIKIDGNPIRCFIDGSLENSDANMTYLLTSNNLIAYKDLKIEITDTILDFTEVKTLEKGNLIDFNTLILD